MKNKLVFVVLFFPAMLYAQQYNVSLIPDTLKYQANIVTRLEEVIYEIKSPSKAIKYERHVYTILNESGDFLGKYRTDYGNFNSIHYVSGNLYDYTGKKLRHFKLNDMSDYNYNDGFSLMRDERYKEFDFFNKNYPYTVDIEEEDEFNGIISIGNWIPQGFNKASVELTKFIVIAPKDYQLRYKAENFSFEPEIKEQGDKKIYTWEMKNLPAKRNIASEVLSYRTLPFVIIAPSDFEAQGYKGNMNTWKNYGKFIYELKKGRDLLPADTRQKVHELTDNLKDEKQKVNLLYEFMQKNTHYISIQLGIGGWQPFDANYVATKGYGDCKALSNYMVALLKEAGINAKYVEIRAGTDEPPINIGFPSFQFNHVITCVPLKTDTIWLECTSQTQPAGYLGSFTADRYGIMIDESGGTLVHTPAYKSKDNLQSRRIIALLNGDGNLSSKIITRYRAERQDRLEQSISTYSKDKLLAERKNGIDLPTYDILNLDYSIKKESIPEIAESIELVANNYAQVSGRRIFINPDILNRFEGRLKLEEDRKFSIRLRNDYLDIDTVEITIPSGYKPESVPQDVKIENKFGKYSSSIQIMPSKILYYRSWEQNSGIFPPADYSELVKYYDEIYKADRNKIVLVKAE
jgi:hypothetical protein